MKHPVLDLMIQYSDPVYFKPHFIDHVEICLPSIKQEVDLTAARSVDPLLSLRFEGDVSGFLQSAMVTTGYYYSTMRLNALRKETDIVRGINSIVHTPINVFERFRKLYQATYNKRKES